MVEGNCCHTFIDRVIGIFLSILFFLVIVFPNSFQLLTFGLLALVSLIICLFKQLKYYRVFIWWLLLSAIISVYIILSSIDLLSKLQLFVKYIVSPIFWLTVFVFIKKNLSMETCFKYLITYIFISCISVIVFYILMINGHITIVGNFINNPNVDNVTGLGLTLHVYGSLIFSSMALGPLLKHIKTFGARLMFVFLHLVAVILSGRSALIFSFVFGLMNFLFFHLSLGKNRYILGYLITSAILILGLTWFYKMNFDISFSDYFLDVHISKLRETLADDRGVQTSLMIEQFLKNPLGTGFVELDILRDDKQKFRYEVLILATLMRFGVVSFILFVISIFPVLVYVYKRNTNVYLMGGDVLLFGFIGIVVASFSNPYLESFCFQWMYFAPVVIFGMDPFIGDFINKKTFK